MRTTENGGQITDFLCGFALAKAVIRFLYSVFCMHLEFFNKKFTLLSEFVNFCVKKREFSLCFKRFLCGIL